MPRLRRRLSSARPDSNFLSAGPSEDSAGFLSYLLPQCRGADHLDAAAEAQDPPHQLPGIGHLKGHPEAPIFQQGELLAWVPDPVLDPGGGGPGEQEFHGDRLSAHDDQRVLHVGVHVETEGHLVGVVGRDEGANAIDGKETHFPPSMVVGNEVEGSGGIPEAIGINLAPGGDVAGGGLQEVAAQGEAISSVGEKVRAGVWR